MSRQLDLRTGASVWSAYRTPRVPVSRLKRDLSCDVLVVGLGISGAMIIEALTARGLSVIGVDRRGPMRGSTASTTALVQFEIDTPLTELGTMIGRSAAEQAWRRTRLAVSNLEARITELGIACHAQPRTSLFLAGNRLGPGALHEEVDARRAAGIRASYLTPQQLDQSFGIARDGAILSHGNLAIDPLKLTAGLLRKAAERKARFLAPVEVTKLVHEGDEIRAETEGGPVIRAVHAVLATGYELLDPVPRENHAIVSTYAIATRPQKRALWPEAAFIWEASDPYLYLRATHDGRVICGGEDEDFQDEDRRDEKLPDKAARIADKLARLLPGIDPSPDFAWAGSFGTTTTGLPFIGALPHRPRLFAVQGYGGNGITYSQIASEVLSTAIAGGEDADAGLFAYDR